MPIFTDQLKEIIKTMSFDDKSNKCSAYFELLRFQEQSREAPHSVHALAEKSSVIVASIAGDIFDEDEEIAAQALKCLGFMLFEPSIAAAISVDDAKLVLGSLTKLITETKIKSVCNLGVWCISIQQLRASLLTVHFNSLLQAVVHALDNPFGSLSTTFEAMQAVMKLAEQLCGKMMGLSHVWAPPVYRRLLSTDKKERDMSERCLLKIKAIISPPPPALSKRVMQDIKQKLLSGMKDLLDKGLKVPTIQAWGWFICLLGSQALKRRQLINDMLKIPEQTFSDRNPQVQIASQVAWEGLIDALIHCQKPDCMKVATSENHSQQSEMRTGNSVDIQSNGFSKSIRLIMTPLIGILSSTYDISVRLSCLKTWSYVLHKLGTSINSPAVMELVLLPVFELCFQNGPDSENVWLWSSCLDLLEDFILTKCRDANSDMNGHKNLKLSARSSLPGASVTGRHSWKDYAIKWMAWDLSQLDFCFKIIKVIIIHVSTAVTTEMKSSASTSALRIFRSVLKGVQIELKNPSITYSRIMLWLDTILKFIKKICEDASSEGGGSYDLFHTCLKFIEAVIGELEPSIMGSPLYKVALDLEYLGTLQSVNDIRHAKVLHQSSVAYMDMVSPVVYLNVLYICVVMQMRSYAPQLEQSLHGLQNVSSFLLSSCDPIESLMVSVDILYQHISFSYIEIWMALAEGLIHYIDGMKEPNLSKVDFEGSNYKAICDLLSYPFFIYSRPWKMKAGGSMKESIVFLEENLEHVIEIWKSAYLSVIRAKFDCHAIYNFVRPFYTMSNLHLDENDMTYGCGSELDLCHKNLRLGFLSLYGEALICTLRQIGTIVTSIDQSKTECGIEGLISSDTHGILQFVSRFMKLSCTMISKESDLGSLISRVFSALADFVTHLHSKQNIVQLFEILTCPLIQWLSYTEKQDQNVVDQLGVLWTESLSCLRRSHPPIIFDSALLKLQADLLEKALAHPSSSISDPTIAYWNSTFGSQINLDFPKNLLHVLDKLSRNGTINVGKRSMPFLQRCHSAKDAIAEHRCEVTATWNLSSKKIQLMEGRVDELERKGPSLPPCSKRKRLELTKRQKEVRRAQQGRERDCSGHGPGVRTYTNMDFSQGNEESQESKEFGDSEAILEILRRPV